MKNETISPKRQQELKESFDRLVRDLPRHERMYILCGIAFETCKEVMDANPQITNLREPMNLFREYGEKITEGKYGWIYDPEKDDDGRVA